MQRRPLGPGGPELSVVGLGTAAIGGATNGGPSWGFQDDAISIRTILAALDDHGYNWIDTAPLYGFGHSEEVVGRAVAGRRDSVFIATKCTRAWDADGNVTGQGDAASIRAECEASLRRLGTDRIDLYQVHGPVPEVPVAETWGELCRLQDDGLVVHIGVSNYNTEQLAECAAIRAPRSLQPGYSMLGREIEDAILPYCRENGIGVVGYAPLMEGLLTDNFDLERLPADDFRRGGFMAMFVPGARDLVARVRPVAAEVGCTVAQLMIGWAVGNPDLTATIVGARTPEQAAANALPGGEDFPADVRERVADQLATAV